MDDLEKLKEHQHLTITKKGKEQTGSVSFVVTESGKEYFAGSVASDTHLLDFTSEQVVLSCAKNRNDLMAKKVVTLLGEENSQGSLLIALKIVADYSLRIGKAIVYEVYDAEGTKVISTIDARKEIPLYAPKVSKLVERLKVTPDRNIAGLINTDEKVAELKKYAKLGVTRNLPTYDAASGYGVAVLLNTNEIVFGGQYGSYDNRLGMHAEMSVVLDALMNDPKRKITDLALVSTKYGDAPCSICGACLQFLAEISTRFGLDISYHCLAFSSDKMETFKLQELLPKRWTSKNW
jgi:cytidine deaminase